MLSLQGGTLFLIYLRYEKPQKGRLREHWQLNVDILGVKDLSADLEILLTVANIMKNFAVNDDAYIIKISHRKFMNYLLETYLNLDSEQSYKVSKLIDRKNKMTAEEFSRQVEEIDIKVYDKLMQVLEVNKLEELPNNLLSHNSLQEIIYIIDTLKKINKSIRVEFDPTIIRGFDYYTGIVFEVYDASAQIKRAMFGGGRYDELIDIFDIKNFSVPAVGFGWRCNFARFSW